MLIFFTIVYCVSINELETAINEYRFLNNKNILKKNTALIKAANLHSIFMAKNHELTHSGPIGLQDVESRITNFNYSNIKTVGENIAEKNDDDLNTLMNEWKENEDDNNNLLGDFTDLGIGYDETTTGRKYYTVVFASKFDGITV